MQSQRGKMAAAWLWLHLRRLGWFYGLGIVISMAALVGFGELADEVLEGDTQPVNVAVLQGLHAHANPFLDRLALTLTTLGGVAGTTVITCLVVVFFLWRRRFLDAVTLALVVLAGGALVTVLKHFFRQPRPDLFESLAPAHGFAFPSGHALLSVCLYGYLAALLVLNGPQRWWRWLGAAALVVLALGIGWSRLYLGVHWFSDVAAGGLVATFWVACCLMARHIAHTRQARRVGSSPQSQQTATAPAGDSGTGDGSGTAEAGGPAQAWFTLPAGAASRRLGVDPASGLSEEEVKRRLARAGPNRVGEAKQETAWETLFEQLREPMILLLLVTGVLYALWGELTDTVVIFAVILTVIGMEIWNERRAERAVSALRKLAEPTALVRRDGRSREVPVEEVVPGDVVLLEAGRRVPADVRLLEAYSLAADESLLSGESVPVEKEADLPLAEGTPLAERRNMAFAGTVVTRGRGRGIVVATGMGTELGRVAGLTGEVKEPHTPLQQSMRELTHWMVWVALGFSILVPLAGWLVAGQPLRQMVLTGLSLAFATIPEELPIIITAVLALGSYRLSRRRAIVKRLRAAETLGAVTSIATDKTGTLTQNRMEVSRLVPEELGRELLEVGVVCNDATGSDEGFAGDPLETALLRAAQAAGLSVTELRSARPLRDEFTFDNDRKRMSVVADREGQSWVAVKGAPEAVLSQCNRQRTTEGARPLSPSDREAVLATAARLAAEGLRVIAFAERTVPARRLSQDEVESDLTFVGLAGLADPPRPEVKDAIAACRSAGIRLLMVTGDHPATAAAIAGQVGLDGAEAPLTGQAIDALSAEELREVVARHTVYARTTPEHKLRIVRALQERGERVAVTGDGVNDAPALAAADIGVAMGETGSDVARAAAGIVLADDNFATIEHAVEEGRLLFANLQKAVRYYLACKVALISATLLPVLLGVPVPFAPIQIILMELLMDLAAAAAFVAERPEGNLMCRPPRNPQTPFMDRAMAMSILRSAAGLIAAVAGTYLLTWFRSEDQAKAQTVAFVTWLLGHVFLAFNLRSEREPVLRQGFFSNRLMVGWAVATFGIALLVTLVPGARAALKTAVLDPLDWALVLGTSLMGTFWVEAAKRLSVRGSEPLRP